MALFIMLLTYLLFLLVSVAIVGLVWRCASVRHSLPCPVWLSGMVDMENPFSRQHHAKVIVKQLELRAGMKVLDAGCGPGRITIPTAKVVGSTGKVVALDLQPGMLIRARKKAAMASLQHVIEFQQATLGTDDDMGSSLLARHEKELFDRALMVCVLGEIPENRRLVAMKEIFNVLKPAGILSITEIICDPHFQRRNVVEDLATAVGFHERCFFGHSLAYTLHFEKKKWPLLEPHTDLAEKEKEKKKA
jgi:ubiquinone/menaquinone biosynthesis C-methylase UbiE